MTTTISFTSSDQKANSSARIEGGFRPQLYTVANGSYISGPDYGTGAALVNTYIPFQLPRGTSTVLNADPNVTYITSLEGCEFRQQDRDVDFSCNITLNATSDPDFGTEEIRINPYPRGFNEPPRYRKALPTALNQAPLPYFNDVEIVDEIGDPVAPVAPAVIDTSFSWHARLLIDGTLALFAEVNLNSLSSNVTTRGLTHEDIDWAATGNAVIIRVRGSYKAQVPVNTGRK